MLNHAEIIGRLTQDPDVYRLNNNETVVNLKIETRESYTDRNGVRKELREWHAVSLYKSLAGIAAKYLKRGSRVYISGRLSTTSWKDAEGIKRSATAIKADRLINLDHGDIKEESKDNQINQI